MHRQTPLLSREYEMHWINNIPVALEGHKVQCGCLNGCVLVAVE